MADDKIPSGMKKKFGVKTREELNTLIYKKSKQINQRFYRLEKKNAGLSEAAYYYAKKETGMEKPRYTVNKQKIAAMSVDQAYAQLLKIEKKIQSDTSTFGGLKKLGQRRIEAQLTALRERDEMSGVTDEQWINFLESGGGLLLNKYMDSTQLIEDWMRNIKKGVTDKEFIDTYNKYIDNTEEPFDLGKVDRELKSIAENKELDDLKKENAKLKQTLKFIEEFDNLLEEYGTKPDKKFKYQLNFDSLISKYGKQGSTRGSNPPKKKRKK